MDQFHRAHRQALKHIYVYPMCRAVRRRLAQSEAVRSCAKRNGLCANSRLVHFHKGFLIPGDDSAPFVPDSDVRVVNLPYHLSMLPSILFRSLQVGPIYPVPPRCNICTEYCKLLDGQKCSCYLSLPSANWHRLPRQENTFSLTREYVVEVRRGTNSSS
jgi:hypothetical protein